MKLIDTEGLKAVVSKLSADMQSLRRGLVKKADKKELESLKARVEALEAKDAQENK